MIGANTLLRIFESFGIFATLFWFWMLYDCWRNERDKQIWLWVIFFLHFIGALIYFFVRWCSRLKIPQPKLLTRLKRYKDLRRAELAVKNIGNPFHFIELGDILLELGEDEKACAMYKEAYEKDNTSKQALWGMALVDFENGRFKSAKKHLENLLELDSGYKLGESSFVYAEVLAALKEWQAAKSHLEKHLERWRHPRAQLLLAEVLVEMGEHGTARKVLEDVLEDIRLGPAYNRRIYKNWEVRAGRMLKNLTKQD